MPRCRKSYRGSRSKAQVPGLSSFPLLIRSLLSSAYSFRPFPSVCSIDRWIDQRISFFRPAYMRASRTFFLAIAPGLVSHLMFQLVSALPSSLPMRLPARVPMFPKLNLLFLAKNSENAQIQLTIANRDARIYA